MVLLINGQTVYHVWYSLASWKGISSGYVIAHKHDLHIAYRYICITANEVERSKQDKCFFRLVVSHCTVQHMLM